MNCSVLPNAVEVSECYVSETSVDSNLSPRPHLSSNTMDAVGKLAVSECFDALSDMVEQIIARPVPRRGQ